MVCTLVTWALLFLGIKHIPESNTSRYSYYIPLSLCYSYIRRERPALSTYTLPPYPNLQFYQRKSCQDNFLSSLRGVVDIVHDGDGTATLLDGAVSSLRWSAAHPPSLPVHQEGHSGQASAQTGNHHYHQKREGTGNGNGQGYDGGR